MDEEREFGERHTPVRDDDTGPREAVPDASLEDDPLALFASEGPADFASELREDASTSGAAAPSGAALDPAFVDEYLHPPAREAAPPSESHRPAYGAVSAARPYQAPQAPTPRAMPRHVPPRVVAPPPRRAAGRWLVPLGAAAAIVAAFVVPLALMSGGSATGDRPAGPDPGADDVPRAEATPVAPLDGDAPAAPTASSGEEGDRFAGNLPSVLDDPRRDRFDRSTSESTRDAIDTAPDPIVERQPPLNDTPAVELPDRAEAERALADRRTETLPIRQAPSADVTSSSGASSGAPSAAAPAETTPPSRDASGDTARTVPPAETVPSTAAAITPPPSAVSPPPTAPPTIAAAPPISPPPTTSGAPPGPSATEAAANRPAATAGAGATASAPRAGGAGAATIPPTELVQAAVNRYRDALNAMDPDAVRAVWPSVDSKVLRFDQIKEQRLRFDKCDITLKDTRAVALCRGSLTYVPKAGVSNEVNARWEFNLQEANDSWVINRVVAR